MRIVTPKRGTFTARELAELYNEPIGRIRRLTAVSREEYLEQAARRHRDIRDLRAHGLSYSQIADEVGVSRGTVQYALAKATK